MLSLPSGDGSREPAAPANRLDAALAHAAGADPEARLARLKNRLATHRLASGLRDAADLRTFMAHHVVCVWDFMSLLKSLQRELTCVDVPWVPTLDPEAARLVNEIVLGEESDRVPDGAGGERVTSHFVWYVEAMAELGCTTGPVRRFVEALRAGAPPREALVTSHLPGPAVAFGLTSLELLDEPLAVRAAVFHHGREDLIPGMLAPLARRLHEERGTATQLLGYLERHVEVDGDVHGPLCEQLLGRLLDAEPEFRPRAVDAARRALEARLALWDAVADLCEQRAGREVRPAR